MISPKTILLRVYLTTVERWHGVPLYRAVVETARQRRLAGASVFPVELGYGSHRRLHDIASEYSSFDIPIVVEIVDRAEQVAGLLTELGTMISEGLAVAHLGRRLLMFRL
jgi:PII-like signaling protein